MKSESNLLIKKTSLIFFAALVLFAHACVPSYATYFDPTHYKPSLDPAMLSAESPDPVEPPWPEQYLDPTVDHSLSLVIPETYRQGLQLDTGYDRWQGLPTMQADYFVPVKHWSDKSIFFAPRVSLTGSEETYSVGAGIRHMLNSDTLIGFHAFHDWKRARGSQESFLKETGVGVELSALPGNFSDISLSMNAYIPTNERNRTSLGNTALIKEAMLQGFDAQVSMLLPPLVDSLDIRLDASGHSFRTVAGTLWGYNTGVTVGSRDGMFNVSLARELNSAGLENYRFQGNVSLAFDWQALINGENPLSAQYAVPDVRYQRKVRDSLYTRTVRQYDVPTQRNEHHVTLAAAVLDDTVSVRGEFAGLADSNVTIQVSQSPWRDLKELRTDSSGSYSARLTLPPGEYRIRLIHKPTGLVSGVTRIIIQDE